MSCLLKTKYNYNNINLDMSKFFKVYINEIRVTIKTTRKVMYKFNYYDINLKKNVYIILILKFYC